MPADAALSKAEGGQEEVVGGCSQRMQLADMCFVASAGGSAGEGGIWL